MALSTGFTQNDGPQVATQGSSKKFLFGGVIQAQMAPQDTKYMSSFLAERRPENMDEHSDVSL